MLTFRQSVLGYFRLWRYEPKQVLLLFGLMYLGWVGLAGGLDSIEVPSLLRVAAGWASSTAILLAIFLINDAADREIDRLVHPERPIPRGEAAWQHVYALGAGLLLLAIVLSLAVNRRAVLVAVGFAALAFLHYGYTKGRLNLPCSSELITPTVSALFPLYALSVSRFSDCAATTALLGFIYFADLAHDLLGGIHDQEGDRQHGVRTFALAIGERGALTVSLLSFLLAVASGVWLFFATRLGPLYLCVVTGLSLFMLFRYGRLLSARGGELQRQAGRVNHLGGGYFFLVSASTFLDFLFARLAG